MMKNPIELDQTPVLEPFKYIASMPSKGMRSIFIKAFEKWISISPIHQATIIDVITKLHNASLLVDDIEDSSDMRRGKAAAHIVYGIPLTINAANLVYFQAMEKVLSLGSESITIFSEEMIQMHLGQGHELYWRDSHICPREEEYLAMVRNKTGGLFRLSVRLMEAVGTSSKTCVELANTLGVHFQIRDDYINLVSSDFHDTKGFAEDLTEGKYSFPIIHCLRTDPENGLKIKEILAKRTTDPDLKKQAIQILTNTGSLEYTRQYLITLQREIEELIGSLGGNEILFEMVRKLSLAYQ